MIDEELTARRVLAQLQDAVAAKDLSKLAELFDDDVVLFGTAAANLDRVQTAAYLARVAGQEGTIRWEWEQVLPLFDRPEVFVFAAIGTVGLDDAQGRTVGEREPFRLTCVAVAQDGHWRLRHFHGSVPEKE
jgi:uncharacterized protein (TIGR02246 family)